MKYHVIIYLIGVCLLVDLASAQPMPWGWKPWVSENTVWVSTGESIAQAVADCPGGGVIYLWPGTYSGRKIDPGDKILFGLVKDAVFWTDTDTLWEASADDYHFENIQITWTGTGQGAILGNYDWSATNCIFKGREWTLPGDTAIFDECRLLPLGSDGWLVNGTCLQLYRCQIGRDIPMMPGSPNYTGLKLIEDAVISCWWTDFFCKGDTTLHLLNTSKAFLYYPRMINDNNPIVVGENSPIIVSYWGMWETGNADGNINAMFCDSSDVWLFSCTMDRQGTPLPITKTVLYCATQGQVKLHHNIFYGVVNIDSSKTLTGTVHGSVGTVDFLSNTIMGTFKDCSGDASFALTNIRRGEPIKYTWYGADAFNSTEQIDTVYVPGLKSSDFCIATSDRKGPGDILSAYPNTDTLFICREAGGIPNLGFNWVVIQGK